MAEEFLVTNPKALQAVLQKLQPGATVLIAPGHYSGDFFLKNVHGNDTNRIIIKGSDVANPPIFRGKNSAFHLNSCSYITISSLEVTGYRGNGINIDDGGDYETPSHHILLEDLRVLNTGPWGNHDALKFSGVNNFIVRNCRLEGWGGSAIDLVGCHHGLIENCHFEGRFGFWESNGVQMKGGSSKILVRQSFFKNAGKQAVKIGGHTGLDYFRPKGLTYEAKDIMVAGNRIVGSKTPIAWITSQGGKVLNNTIVFPLKSAMAIIQGTKDSKFISCQQGSFSHNLVVFDRRMDEFIQIGIGTKPETFTFAQNAWFQVDGSTVPNLPTTDKEGVYQIDPEIDSYESASMRIQSSNPLLKGIGADAYSEMNTNNDSQFYWNGN